MELSNRGVTIPCQFGYQPAKSEHAQIRNAVDPDVLFATYVHDTHHCKIALDYQPHHAVTAQHHSAHT